MTASYQGNRGGPQIGFALSRGFGKVRWGLGDVYPGRRAHRFALVLGYYRPPLQGFQFAASPSMVGMARCAVGTQRAALAPPWRLVRGEEPFCGHARAFEEIMEDAAARRPYL